MYTRKEILYRSRAKLEEISKIGDRKVVSLDQNKYNTIGGDNGENLFANATLVRVTRGQKT